MSAIMKETEVIGGLITPITKETDYAFKYNGTNEYTGILIERFGNVRTLTFNQYNVNIANVGAICRSDGSVIALGLDAKDIPKSSTKTGLIVYTASSSADSQLTPNYAYTALCTISTVGSVTIRPIVNGAYAGHTDPKAFLMGVMTYMV